MSSKADQLAKLKRLECHFTWDINRGLLDLKGISEKLPDRIKFCHSRYHAVLYNVLAYACHLKEENTVALGFLTKAEKMLRERKDDTELLVTYGNCAWLHYHIGNMEKMNEWLNKINDIIEAHPEASKSPCKLPIIHGEKGHSFLRLGAPFYQRAKESFEEALKGEPDNISFNAGYAVILYRLEGMKPQKGRDKEESSQMQHQLEKALNLEPDNAEAMVLLALHLQFQGRERLRSKDLIGKALELAPEIPQVTRYAAKYFRMEGDVEESINVLEKALELAPTSSFLFHQIGLCHKQLLIRLQQRKAPQNEIKSKATECVGYFRKAVDQKPNNVYAWVNLAESYAESGQQWEAEKAYTEMQKNSLMTLSDRQHCLVSYGLFLMYTKRNESGAVTQLQAAYRIPVQSSDRDKAGKKLRALAERMGKRRRAGEARSILQFLKDEDDKLRRKATEGDAAGSAKMAAVQKGTAEATDDLTEAFSKGIKLI